ncbi:MAG: ATP-binding cassette domain-containing protein [Planctomycetes bacterium]|nr:ATP-binding cassette domain-containing protein [Planctomycetota bacterium]
MLIEVQGLCKSYGAVRALDCVSFSVEEGEVLGFLGPNGAGKTTALRILSGFLPGDEGVVQVAGLDVRVDSLAVRSVIGYLPEGVPLYPDMRVSEYLRFRARLKGVPRRRRREQIERSLESTGTTDVRGRIIGTLSRGYRQRVGLADALLNEPKVLILDEPTVGLDPEQVRQFRALLRNVGRERTVILSTHILSEVEIVCSSVVIIDRGRIAARDRAENLRSRLGRGLCVIAEIRGPQEDVARALRGIPGVRSLSRAEPAGDAGEGGEGGYVRYRLTSGAEDDLRERVYDCVRSGGWWLRLLQEESLPLEDVFLDIVGRKT